MSYIGNQPLYQAFLTDQFNGTGSLTTFTMSVAPANPASVLVSVSGVLQSPDTYSVSGTTLTFSGAPPAGTANISVRYMGIPASGVTTTAYRTVTEFTATAGQTTFTPPSYTVGFIAVFRNGVRLGSADYTASNGTTVVLASAASANDLVVTESFYVSSVLNAIPNTAGAVNSTNLAAGSVTQTALAAGVAGNGPAFSAYLANNQSVNQNTWTKCNFDTETFDTNNNFASNRFTPTVAGYYMIVGSVYNSYISSYANGNCGTAIYKNGSVYAYISLPFYTASTTAVQLNVQSIIYMNGSTDYVEMYGYNSNQTGSAIFQAGSQYTYFNGCLLRTA